MNEEQWTKDLDVKQIAKIKRSFDFVDKILKVETEVLKVATHKLRHPSKRFIVTYIHT